MIPDICDDELQKLRPIYQDEIASGIGSYNNNMTDLREQINDKNITLTEQEIRNKISGLKTNNIQLQQDISYYISRRKGNCEMDTDKDGIIMDSESGTMFGGSMQGFTNMFSKNTFKEALQTLKKDQKFLENMDNQYNKTTSDIETDLIKNEYRTGAYALGIVIVGGLTPVEICLLLSEEGYQQALAEYGSDMKVGMGAEAIMELLQEIELKKTFEDLKDEIANTKSQAKNKRNIKRLKLIESFIKSGNKPEWMILSVLPVLPPDLRPLVPLEGGRFATSD